MSSFVFEKENPEFLAVLEAVAVDKDLKKEVLNRAVETAFEEALSVYFKGLYDVTVKINRNSGAVSAFKRVVVCEEVVDSYKQIDLPEAKKYEPDAVLGQEILISLPVAGFSSSIISNISHLIGKEIQKKEKEAEYAYFQKLEGSIVNGIIKKAYFGGFLVNIDKYEAFLGKFQLLPTEFEKIRPGDRIDAFLYELEKSDTKPQALLTRTNDTFLYELLRQAIPEIYDETVEITSLAREPGSRAKVAVRSKDPSIDPVFLISSKYLKKISDISRQLCGERIDIVEFNKDPGVFLMNALNPKVNMERASRFKDAQPQRNITISKITVDFDNKSLDVILESSSDISLAIGRKGQNVRLLSKLIGWSIHLTTENESSDKKLEAFVSKTNSLIEELNIDDIVAQLLVMEGFDTCQKIAKNDNGKNNKTLSEIEGFDEEIISLLQDRASEVLNSQKKAEEDKAMEVAKKAEELVKNTSCSLEFARQLIKAGVDTTSKLAELSIDEIVEDLKIEGFERDEIGKAITKSRGF